MRKYLLIASVIFVLIIGFTVFYMSNYGLKTNKFNDLIYSKLEELNPKLKINLDQVFIKLNLTEQTVNIETCLLYTSPSPRDRTRSRMPSSA